MKKQPEALSDDLRPEYDFSGSAAERGKYYQRYRQGHAVRIEHRGGSVSVSHFGLEDGAVLLDPDVRAFFPDSDAVNHALRTLIGLVPKKPVGAH